MPIFIVDGAAPSSTFIDRSTQTSINSSYTFAGVSSGTASGDRYLIVAVAWHAVNTPDITDCQVDNTSATQLVTAKKIGSGESMGVALYSIAAPTGTTVDIDLTFTGNCQFAAVATFAVTGWSGGSYNQATDAADPADLSVNVPAYSTVIGFLTARNNLTTDPSVRATWTGIVEVLDINFGTGGVNGITGACEDFTTTHTPLSITCNPQITGSLSVGCSVALYN